MSRRRGKARKREDAPGSGDDVCSDFRQKLRRRKNEVLQLARLRQLRSTGRDHLGEESEDDVEVVLAVEKGDRGQGLTSWVKRKRIKHTFNDASVTGPLM